MNINREILKCLIEINALLFIVIVTYPVMSFIGESEGSKIAEFYDNYETDRLTLYYEKQADLSNLFPVTEEYALNNFEKSIINVVNNTNENKVYNLVLIIEKNSTLDTKYLKININGKTYKLDDLYYTENNYVKYFIIDNNTVKKESINYNNIYIWLDYETPNSEQNKTLTMNFDILCKSNINI